MPELFSKAPQVSVSRSKFPVKHTHKTSFNVGQLVPINVEEVLPGDTKSIDLAAVLRVTSGFVKVPMDNLYADIYAFFVPSRLVWKHAKEFFGENTSSAWIPQTTYEIPQIALEGGLLQHGTALSHMLGLVSEEAGSLPSSAPYISVNALPVRAYCKIWNDFFRDENLQQPIPFEEEETTVYMDGISNNNYVTGDDGSCLLPVNKFHDYFTSALPNTQKGDPVTISLTGDAPVMGYYYTDENKLNLAMRVDGSQSVQFNTIGQTSTPYIGATSTFDTTAFARGFDPTNRIGTAELSNISLVTINELRTAFQLQRFLEKDARAGTRYIELVKAHFGVTNPDYRLQRPEFLGHLRQMINVDQVLQTSATGDTGTAQGNVAGYSLTGVKGSLYTKSFTEHGYVLTLVAVRYKHSYQEGINKMWSRKNKFDFYWPVFANIGEQPILQKEIYCKVKDENENVFGYQEAWADYRYDPDMVSGQLSSGASNSLDIWHFGDYYDDEAPSLSSSWLKEDISNVDRTLNVGSSNADQIIADFLFTGANVRCMPTYSIPGLIDHN